MLQQLTPVRQKTQQAYVTTKDWTQRNWIKLLLIALFAYTLLHKDLNFSFDLNSTQTYQAPAEPSAESQLNNPVGSMLSSLAAVNLGASVHQKKDPPADPRPNVALATAPTDENLSNTYSNMTYDSGKEKRSSKDRLSEKRKKQNAYVQRFAAVAQSEMRKYGIPASISLAQGLIESNAGESRLALKNNNHFGMKCFSRKCGKGHCSNFTDDSHKDFFRIYKTAWESYRAHSLLLNGKRYAHLKKLGTKNYKDWAYGLKKAGYATDRRYAEKLIHIIKELELYRFDD